MVNTSISPTNLVSLAGLDQQIQLFLICMETHLSQPVQYLLYLIKQSLPTIVFTNTHSVSMDRVASDQAGAEALVDGGHDQGV